MATHVAHASTARGRAVEFGVDVRVWWRAYGTAVLAAVAVLAVVAGCAVVVGIAVAHWSQPVALLVAMVVVLAAVLVAAWKWVERP